MNIENLTEDEKEEFKRLYEKMNEPEFKYPIYKKLRTSDLVVKFTGINTGFRIFDHYGNFVNSDVEEDNWNEHTNTGLWEDFDPSELNKPRDKALVWCWDDGWKFSRYVCFYDPKNNATFSVGSGLRTGASYDNYESIPKDQWPEWAEEVVNKLED